MDDRGKIRMLTNIRNHLNKSAILKILHRIACALGSLVAAFGLLTCVCQFYSALCDLHRHSGLGFSYKLQYFLRENHFGAWVVFFLLVTGELVLYIFCAAGSRKRSQLRGAYGIWGRCWQFMPQHGSITIHSRFQYHTSMILMTQNGCIALSQYYP